MANLSRSSPISFLSRLKSPVTALHGPHHSEYTSITEERGNCILRSLNNLIAYHEVPPLRQMHPNPIDSLQSPTYKAFMAFAYSCQTREYLLKILWQAYTYLQCDLSFWWHRCGSLQSRGGCCYKVAKHKSSFPRDMTTRHAHKLPVDCSRVTCY